MHGYARHCRRAPERQRNFVPTGIARLEVRTLIGFVLVPVHGHLGVIVTGETVPMFRVVVPDVRVRVQAGHLTSRRQEGNCHDERERALHALSVYGSTGSRSTRQSRAARPGAPVRRARNCPVRGRRV